jgi:hypothetical protein
LLQIELCRGDFAEVRRCPGADELLMQRFERGLQGRTQFDEFVADQPRGFESLDGVEQVMRIAFFVEAAGHRRPAVVIGEPAHAGADIQIGRASGLHTVVARAGEQVLEPGVFDAEPDLDEEIGLLQFSNETRQQVDDMGIFRAFGKAEDADLIAAEPLGEALEVRRGNSDA